MPVNTQPNAVATRRNRHGGTTAVVLLVALFFVLCLVGGAIWALQQRGETVSQPTDVVFEEAFRGTFEYIVLAQGEIESSENVELKCQVKARNAGGATILSVLTEGTEVKKGDLVIEFDASALADQRVQQQIVCNTSKAIMIQAENVLEAAKIAKREYEEGTFKQEEQQLMAELFVAQENLRRAQEYAKFSQRLAAKGYVTDLQLEGDKFAVDKARNELSAAETKLRVLREFTRQKNLKQLDSDIVSLTAKWEAEQSSHQLELDKLKLIEEQEEKCRVLAPQDGTVVYANEYGRGGTAEFEVREGAVVREGQTVVRLPNSAKMQVKAKINESRIALIKPGMLAMVHLDAVKSGPVFGEVIKVNQYAEPRSWSSGSIREYAAFIRIDEPPAVIRSGMNAEVQIQIEKRNNALQLPVQGVCEQNGRFYSLVKFQDQLVTREVEVGSSNQKTVTIQSGIEEGEEVVLAPRLHPALDLPDDVSEPEAMAGKSERGQRPQNFADNSAGGGRRQGGQSGERPSGGKRGREGGQGGEGQRPSADDIVTQIMSSIDSDADGKISSTELAALPEDQQQRTKAADADGDGSITRAELLAAIAARRNQRGQGG